MGAITYHAVSEMEAFGGYYHKGPDFNPIAEFYGMITVLLKETGGDDIRGGTDNGDVAAVAGAEKQRPPEYRIFR